MAGSAREDDQHLDYLEEYELETLVMQMAADKLNSNLKIFLCSDKISSYLR